MTVSDQVLPATVASRPGPSRDDDQVVRGSDFAALSRRIKGGGLLQRRYGYYVARISFNLLLFAGVVVAFVALGDSWWQLAVAPLFAVLLTQFAYVGHDAGHRQIATSRRWNEVIGHTHAALTGISYQWWVDKHNRHHANPNHEDEDPDIDIPVLAFSEEQARAKRGAARWVVRHQAFFFFPLLTVEAIMLRAFSVSAVVRREVSRPVLEGVLLVAHIAAYLTMVFLVLSPLKAVLFIAVHQALMGIYLGCSFAPNHKGMPVLAAGQKLDFLRKQVLTSRNVSGGRWVDFLLGGLNHQIEHHLFPNMPRPNLRRARPIVAEFCAERGVPYCAAGLLGSYAEVLRHLHQVGAPLRRPVAAAGTG